MNDQSNSVVEIERIDSMIPTPKSTMKLPFQRKWDQQSNMPENRRYLFTNKPGEVSKHSGRGKKWNLPAHPFALAPKRSFCAALWPIRDRAFSIGTNVKGKRALSKNAF